MTLSNEAGEPHDPFHLMVLKGFTGEIYRVEVSPIDTAQQALPAIADAIGYFSSDWQRVGLYNLTWDFEYAAGDRLIDRGTCAGDLVIIADGAAYHE